MQRGGDAGSSLGAIRRHATTSRLVRRALHRKHGDELPGELTSRSVTVGASPLIARAQELQRSIGNRAMTQLLQRQAVPPAPVAAAAPIGRFEPIARIETMTLSEFDGYAQTHADWASDPALPRPRKATLIRLLEWARGGAEPPLAACGEMIVSALTDTRLTTAVLRKLDAYARAVRATDTLRSPTTALVAEGLERGEAVQKLESSVQKTVLNNILGTSPANDQFLRLISERQVDNFVNYVRRGRPALEASNGADVRSYLDMTATRQPESFIGRVPHVRNYHRFLPDMLDTLRDNWRDHGRTKPLQLILHSGTDHNGAFHRDAQLEFTVQHDRNLTLMVEGAATLDAAGDLAADIARNYGQTDVPRGPGRINQLMIAGHGSSQVIELGATIGRGGEVTATDAVDLKDNRARSEAFLARLSGLMGGPDARVALNACLTASDEVAGPLADDPAEAERQIRESLRDNPSLVTKMESLMPGITVQGNLSSVGAGTYTDAATGLLEQTVATDPAATSTDRAEYIEKGREAEGCMRAVVRVWALDRPECLRRVEAWRAAHGAPGSWDELVIKTFYDLVVAHPDDVEFMNRIANSAARGLSEFDLQEEQKPSILWDMQATFTGPEQTMIFGPLYGPANAAQQVAIDQLWMQTVPARSANFLAALDRIGTPTIADPHLDLMYVEPKLAELLPVAAAPAPSRAQVKLALWAVLGGRAAADAVSFLHAGSVASRHLAVPAITTADALLAGSGATEDDVLRTIGVLPPAGGAGPGPGPGPAPDPPNVDTDGDGVYDLYVTPLTRHGGVTAQELHVRAQPDMTGAVVGSLTAGAKVYIIGRSGDWFAIERAGATRFVHHRWIRLSGTP